MDEIVATPSFKKALGKLLNEHDCQAKERQHKAEQQMLQLRNQLSTVLATLTALGTQSSSNSNVAPPPRNQSLNAIEESVLQMHLNFYLEPQCLMNIIICSYFLILDSNTNY